MTEKDRIAIQTLAKEGKQISKIAEQDFPEYGYWEIFQVVWEGGGKSALGVKRTVTNRLATLLNTTDDGIRADIVEEIGGLVQHLYDSLKNSQQKLDTIRQTLNS